MPSVQSQFEPSAVVSLKKNMAEFKPEDTVTGFPLQTTCSRPRNGSRRIIKSLAVKAHNASRVVC